MGSAPACYGSTLGSNPDISKKYKNGRHKQRSGQLTLARQKLYKKAKATISETREGWPLLTVETEVDGC